MNNTVESETINVCGKYCGECVHAQWGSGDKEKYYTWCEALTASVLNTNNPLDQCLFCVLEE